MAGTLALTRDRRELKAALALKEAIDAVMSAMEAHTNLPTKAKDEPHAKPDVVQNPVQ